MSEQVQHPRVEPPPPADPPTSDPPFEPPIRRRELRRDIRKAVALEYRGGKQRAPLVTAFGKGELARQIIELAQANGIHVQPDPDLVELLAQVDVGAAIPPQLYYVVAEILAFVYRLNAGSSGLGSPAPGNPGARTGQQQ